MNSFFLLLLFVGVECDRWADLWLPEEHIPYYFYRNIELKKQCKKDKKCPYKDMVNMKKCWGFETGCSLSNTMSRPQCSGDPPAHMRNRPKSDHISMFWDQGDFGNVKTTFDSIKEICVPKRNGESSLHCSSHARYCKATHLFMDFKNLNPSKSTNGFREDVFASPGRIGGYCKLNQDALLSLSGHKSPLQSWYAEIEHYKELKIQPWNKKNCDITITRPTIIIKLDAGVNMYHHYCDFINIYVSQLMNNSLSADVQFVYYITSPYGYGDLFKETWQAFTKHEPIFIREWDQKRVCIKDAMFPLLARQRLGLYYNMPVVWGCHGSSLFRAFNQHLVHRLNLSQDGPLKSKLRLTILVRSSKQRQILNINELISILKKNKKYKVSAVDFKYREMPFLEQVQISHNSDIFMGIHGAGLTHMLYQPDWGSVMEIYNCEDPNCYRDLAALRGLFYVTWEDDSKMHPVDEGHHPTLGAHKKFTNYTVDATEFARLVKKAANHVFSHPGYIRAWKQRHGDSYPHDNRHEEL